MDVTALGLAILVSAVLVFVASAVLHMVLPFHREDVKRIPQEDRILDAVRDSNVAPGEYAAPMPASPGDMSSPAFVQKLARGPVVFMTVAATGSPSVARNLAVWFVYVVVVTILVAFLALGALPRGAGYHRVFHTVLLAAFLGYAMALPQRSIWFRASWVVTAKGLVDGLIYGVLTAGTFAWLWPR